MKFYHAMKSGLLIMNNILIKEIPTDERPRERLVKYLKKHQICHWKNIYHN